MNNCIQAILLLFFAGCVSAPKLYITTSTPAKIEKGGIIVCETTPCEIGANYYTDGYGLGCVGSRETPLEAFPIDKKMGTTQYKVVEAQCGQTSNIFFDMESARGIKNSGASEK